MLSAAALKRGPDTPLPVSEPAREMLRKMRDGWKRGDASLGQPVGGFVAAGHRMKRDHQPSTDQLLIMRSIFLGDFYSLRAMRRRSRVRAASDSMIVCIEPSYIPRSLPEQIDFVKCEERRPNKVTFEGWLESQR